MTTKWMGKSPTLTPRTPICRNEDEPDTPRICTATSIEGCYKSLRHEMDTWTRRWPAFHVYATEAPTAPPKGVLDARRNGERWILEPCQFRHVGKMPRIKMTDLRPFDQTIAHQSRIIAEYVNWARWITPLGL